jgi:hypothetical protein
MKGGAEGSGKDGMQPVRGKKTWQELRLSWEGQVWPSDRVGLAMLYPMLPAASECDVRFPCVAETKASETSVNSYQSTQCYNPEDIHLHGHCRENFKSYRASLHHWATFLLTLAWQERQVQSPK